MTHRAFPILFAAGVLLALLSADPAYGRAEPKGRIHALLVLDTRAPGIGPYMDRDEQNIRKVLEGGLSIAAQERYLRITTIKGNAVSGQAIRAYYRNLNAGPDDTLVFYYSGHGATTTVGDKSQHVFRMFGPGKEEVLPRDEVRSWMTALRPRLAILLTESCSTTVQRLNAQGAGPRIEVRALRPEGIAPGIRRLFFEERGIVDINAAYEGSYSWADNDGGLFTRYLAQTFSIVQNSEEITWLKLSARIREHNEDMFQEWKARSIASARKAGEWSPTTVEVHRNLEAQKLQAAQVYFIPGIRLGVATGNVGGDQGVRVVGFTVGSAMERAGIKLNEEIVAAEGQPIRHNDDWDAVMDPKLDRNQRQFKLKVRDTSGKLREVVVSLDP